MRKRRFDRYVRTHVTFEESHKVGSTRAAKPPVAKRLVGNPREERGSYEVRPQLNPTPSVVVHTREFRGVAQSGRALRSGRRGPRFESGRPDCKSPRSGTQYVRARMRTAGSSRGAEPNTAKAAREGIRRDERGSYEVRPQLSRGATRRHRECGPRRDSPRRARIVRSTTAAQSGRPDCTCREAAPSTLVPRMRTAGSSRGAKAITAGWMTRSYSTTTLNNLRRAWVSRYPATPALAVWSAGRMVLHSPRKRAPERAWGFESLALRFSPAGY